MEAKKISQKAVKNMVNSNTTLLHIGNYETGKRTNLKRAVNECVYASRLYYNRDLLVEALTEFGSDMSYLERGAEACDVTIRCYLLGQAISKALDEIETEEE